jgi:hypothetical protein
LLWAQAESLIESRNVRWMPGALTERK